MPSPKSGSSSPGRPAPPRRPSRPAGRLPPWRPLPPRSRSSCARIFWSARSIASMARDIWPWSSASDAFHHLLAPVTLPARAASRTPPHPVHLVEELAELLRRELAGVDARQEAPRLAEHDLVLALREIPLEVRQAVDAARGAGCGRRPASGSWRSRALRRDVRVLERRRQVALGVLAALRVGTRLVVAVLHLHALDGLHLLRRRTARSPAWARPPPASSPPPSPE